MKFIMEVNLEGWAGGREEFSTLEECMHEAEKWLKGGAISVKIIKRGE